MQINLHDKILHQTTFTLAMLQFVFRCYAFEELLLDVIVAKQVRLSSKPRSLAT